MSVNGYTNLILRGEEKSIKLWFGDLHKFQKCYELDLTFYLVYVREFPFKFPASVTSAEVSEKAIRFHVVREHARDGGKLFV